MAGFTIKKQTSIIVLRLFLGGILAWASIHKIVDPLAFARVIQDYRLLPSPFINPCAVILPCLELLLGVCLISGLWLPGAALLTNLLFLVFSGALGFNMLRGLDVQCGCFSSNVSENQAAIWYLIRNVGFVFLAGYLLVKVIKDEEYDTRKVFY
ncbi:MAG: DoxX family membrane protein [Deltaproteobacteria bacterium]|nr:DoxX family membrane protein [Deltaproteobacteria bacterium]